MGFGKFGSKPRKVNNPLYWVNRYRQDERTRGRQHRQSVHPTVHQQLVIDQFNEKWHRLIDIHERVIAMLIEPLNGRYIKESIAIKLIAYTKEAAELRKLINARVGIPDEYKLMKNELAKYATVIKMIALLASKVCTKLEIYHDIENAKYDASSKSILLNESIVFFMG
ncbi:MAG: hypothetical protein WB870_03720 [Gallionellaceae bacterium]